MSRASAAASTSNRRSSCSSNGTSSSRSRSKAGRAAAAAAGGSRVAIFSRPVGRQRRGVTAWLKEKIGGRRGLDVSRQLEETAKRWLVLQQHAERETLSPPLWGPPMSHQTMRRPPLASVARERAVVAAVGEAAQHRHPLAAADAAAAAAGQQQMQQPLDPSQQKHLPQETWDLL
ncbi:hypothetical protein ACSSS7_007816 [Eimeria intestinalis]